MIVEFASLPELKKWLPLLTAEERAVADTKVNAAVRARFVVGRGMRRGMLSAAASVNASELRFADEEDGKPMAVNAGRWQFNISHAGDYVACAVAQKRIGIDIERIRPVREMQSIVSRYFHPDEANAWLSLAHTLREEAFFVFWSAREAAMKCAGLGLAKGLSVTRVDPAILQSPDASARVGNVDLIVRRVDAPHGYVGMVALADSR